MINLILTASSGNEVKNDFTEFLKNYAVFICIGLVVIILAVIFALYVFKRKKKNNVQTINGNDIVAALGGASNIEEVNRTGSRISVKLQNTQLINKDKLKENGISNIVAMSNKVTLVASENSENIEELIKKSLQ